jgi:hypothetical protein
LGCQPHSSFCTPPCCLTAQVAQWKLPPIRTLRGAASPRHLAEADARGCGAAPILDAELHACLAEFDEVRRARLPH